MALNYFSNRIYGSQIQPNNNYQDQSFLTFPPTQFQLPPSPHFSNPNNNLTISESFIDPFLPIEPSYQNYNDFTQSETNYYLSPNSPTYNNYLYDHQLSPPFNPKRQRYFYEDYDSFIPNPPVFFQEFVGEQEESSNANVVLIGNNDDSNKKKNNNGVENAVSAQSIAARQRRRRISEKTQELGKLIPGGQRMNTAEMFHAAFKHIKFLQAQVGIFELMDSLHMEIKEEETWDTREMAAAVTCPRIQEKLHLKEKCLVPKQVLKSLVNHPKLNSNVASLLEEFILTIA